MKPSVYMKRLQRVIATGGILTIAVSRSLAQAPQQIDHAAETKHFLNSARASGPPFAADLLLKFAAKNPRDPSTNSIIDEAFNAAIFSREAMPYAFGGTSLDTLPGKVALASQVGITRLSLQFRAVLLMLPLNPKAARDMFSEVRLPSMPSHACGDVLLYDLSGYYNALREIADFGFTQAEKAKELHLDLWRSQLESLTSIAQIEPLAMNLARSDITDPERSDLARTFSGAIASVPADRQQLVRQWSTISNSIRYLLERIDSLSANRLLSATRSMMSRNLQAAACPPFGTVHTYQTVEEENSSLIGSYNQLLSKFATDPTIPKLREADYRVNLLERGSDPPHFWSSSRARDLLRRVQAIRSIADKESPSWHDAFDSLSHDLIAWTGDGEPSKAAFYCEKSELLFSLITMPSGTVGRSTRTDPAKYYGDQPTAARQNLSLLEAFIGLATSDNDLRQEYPSLWARYLIEFVDVTSKFRRGEINSIKTALARRSADGVILAYFNFLATPEFATNR